MSGQNGKLVWLGRISGVYGVKGWLKILSYTEPRDNILGFDHWLVEHRGSRRRMELEDGREHGKGVIAKLSGIDDRDRALEWLGAEIAVERDALPPLDPGDYYWADLEGLLVRTLDGTVLGRVDHLLATGAHDVLVVQGEREILIPFVPDEIIREVDVGAGVIVAVWDPEPGED